MSFGHLFSKASSNSLVLQPPVQQQLKMDRMTAEGMGSPQQSRSDYQRLASSPSEDDVLLLPALRPLDACAASLNNNDNNNMEQDCLITIDQAIDRLGFGRFQYMILTASGLCFAADGMQVILLSFLTAVLKDEWSLSDGQAAGLASTLFAGAMLGTLFLGSLADRMGRRPVFCLAASIISLAGLGTAVAPNFATIVTAVFCVGIGVGGLTVPFDILAEFLPSRRRGTNLLLIEYFWTAGVLYVVALAYFWLDRGPDAWRIFTGLCVVPCFLSLVVGYFCVPESPRWLASKGRLDEAMQVIRHAAAINDVSFLFPATLSLQPEPEMKHATLLDLFEPKWREVILRLWGAWFAFAFGYYGILLVTTRIFSLEDQGDAKMKSSINIDYSAIFVSSMAEFMGTTLVIVAVDRVGRIPSQVASYTLAGVLLCVLCVLAEWGASRRTLMALGFSARVFEMAGTCVTWVSTAEILTTEVRATGHSTANALARLGAFCCPFFVEGNTPLIRIGVAILLAHFFTAICVSKLPETKGRDMGLTILDESVNADDTLALVFSSCIDTGESR